MISNGFLSKANECNLKLDYSQLKRLWNFLMS